MKLKIFYDQWQAQPVLAWVLTPKGPRASPMQPILISKFFICFQISEILNGEIRSRPGGDNLGQYNYSMKKITRKQDSMKGAVGYDESTF